MVTLKLMARTTKRLRAPSPAVAYHEAGHVVVARVLGYDVRSVSIEQKPDSSGRISWRSPVNRRVRQKLEWADEADFDRVRHRIDHVVIVAYAGSLAMKRHNPRSHWRYGRSGAQRGGLMLKGSDEQQALELLCRVHEDETVRAAYARYLEARAQAMVNQHWPRIEQLAQALLRHGILRDDDIVKAMQHPELRRRQLTEAKP